MKVTQEMVAAFNRAVIENGRLMAITEKDVRVGLIAALELIDPVPEDVTVIYDRDFDEWCRNPEDPMVWRLTDGSTFRTYRDIEERYGPITWEGK